MSGAAQPDPARVASIFEDVVELAPEDAARRLDLACAGDDALRAAVERLVAHDRAAAPGFLALPAGLIAEVQRAQEIGAATRLGHFFVLRKLGEGGMGVVYLGYDDALDRQIALKLLHPGVAARDWLLREGRALGRLAHPNVVAVHEIGEHEGRVFLAMELVEGPSLRAWLEERRRPFAEILGMLLQAGRGLAAVHEAGLVHRDFKPDNVLVGRDGRARVADFGIAVDGAPRSGTPEDGGPAGTPAFMAPELRGGARATAASDQWSFCVTLHRAVYGVRPGEAVARRDPDVPAWLDPLLRRGLAAEPAERFPSMAALLAAVEGHLPRDPDADPGLVRREQRIVVAVLLLLAVLITAAVVGPGTGSVLAGEWALVRLALVVVAVTGAVIARLWRRLAKNLYGRRVASLLFGAGLSLLAHRLIAVRLGTPMLHVLVVDHVMLTTLFAVAAITLERSFGWFALLGLAGTVVSAARPPLAPLSFGVLTVLVPAIALALLARRR